MAELTREEMMNKMMEMFRSMRDEIMENLDNVNKKMDGMVMEIKNDNKLWREELRNERTKEIKNDSQPETEEIPNDKTKEQVVVFSENKTNGNKENTKQRGMKSKKMRRMYPRNLIKTTEEMEMMNHGLIDINNIPNTNDKDIMNARDYGRRLKVISEMIYDQTVVYNWERTRGK